MLAKVAGQTFEIGQCLHLTKESMKRCMLTFYKAILVLKVHGCFLPEREILLNADRPGRRPLAGQVQDK